MPSFLNLLTTGALAFGLVFVALGDPGAFAAPILASATRTGEFSSTSTAPVPVPLRDDNTTSLQFATTVNNQSIVIIYNAECVVGAARGTRLSIKVLVDFIEALPSSDTDFAL